MTKVLVVGLGNMGLSHALAHHHNQDAQIVALVNRSKVELPANLCDYPYYDDFTQALAQTKPDLVCIATYTESHAPYALEAFEAGAHVFVEKPLATAVADAQQMVDKAVATKRKLVVGYILRHHPGWIRLVKEARALGGPYVFRLNLNQQSTGDEWKTHKALIKGTPPIVDCGVHYVDVMCQITHAKPVRVHGIGLRLSDELPEQAYNYGQFQVVFEDGSVGWYEAGWGPMMSETAHFVKDVVSPNGAVSITDAPQAKSADIGGHTSVGQLLVHSASGKDRVIELDDEPGHQQLCDAQQTYMLKAIADDIDLTDHMQAAVQSLRICLAADQSVREKIAINL